VICQISNKIFLLIKCINYHFSKRKKLKVGIINYFHIILNQNFRLEESRKIKANDPERNAAMEHAVGIFSIRKRTIFIFREMKFPRQNII
jgi:hypothetical protein